MQTLAVLLIGGLLGPGSALSAVAGYLALGLAGAPVFHGGLAGPAVLAGPTGGYLIGFIAAAFVMGFAVHGLRGSAGAGARVRTTGPAAVRMAPRRASSAAGPPSRCWPPACCGELAIYAVGVPWLALFTGGDLGAGGERRGRALPAGRPAQEAVAIGALRAGGAGARPPGSAALLTGHGILRGGMSAFPATKGGRTGA